MLRIHKLALGAAALTAVWAAALARPELTGTARTAVLLVRERRERGAQG
jgi:hypothetical protein